MKRLLSGLLLVGLISSGNLASAQDRGQELFAQTCFACHTVGGGRLIGPDLANVHLRRDEHWLIQFVQSSQALAKSGDADAIALLAEYNGLVMPDQPLSENDVRELIKFIASTSPAEAAPPPVIAEVKPEDLAARSIQLGQDLFIGSVRFENGASACNSCHSVDTYAAMTGGSLAINLTDAVSRLGRTGVDAMMASPPFPAMRAAFETRPLTDAERTAIADFLQANEVNNAGEPGPQYGFRLAGYGLAGLAALLVFFFLLSRRNTKQSINQALYDRQLTSA